MNYASPGSLDTPRGILHDDYSLFVSHQKYYHTLFMLIQQFGRRLKILIGAALVCTALSGSSQGFINSGVSFSDYLFIDVAPNANFQLSTTGDIYVWTPSSAGLFGISMGFRALRMVPNVPLRADDYITFNLAPALAPTFFQDVVLRVSGPVGRIQFEADGGIVVDTVPVAVPEPATLSWLAAAAIGVVICRRERLRRKV